MSPWFGYAIFVLGHTAGGVIRLRHERRSKLVPVAESRKGIVEVFLLALLTIAILLPLLAMATSLLSFANYAPCLACVVPGAVFMGLYVWLLYRSHADLGDNWSFTLQVRRDHRLVTSGIYGSIRHPMYAALYMLGDRPDPSRPELRGGPGHDRRVHGDSPPPGWRRGADDDRPVRRRLSSVCRQNEASHSRYLVDRGDRAGALGRVGSPCARGSSCSHGRVVPRTPRGRGGHDGALHAARGLRRVRSRSRSGIARSNRRLPLRVACFGRCRTRRPRGGS